MSDWNKEPFKNGSEWVRADFHLHTRADKEFSYSGEETSFVTDYVEALKVAGIRVAVITNHNKFDVGEYKAIRTRARKEGICVLPGVELSVNDGANGVHTLVVFSDEWLRDGKDFINQFIGSAFKGKVPEDYEQENGRSSSGLVATLEALDQYHKDFFCVFAHVEAASGLWNELEGGRIQELAKEPLVQQYCLGFQKVRTHDKPDSKCRVKVKNWWGPNYPAEVEGCDAKRLDQVGRGEAVFIKVGEPSFESVKYALSDHGYRVSKSPETVSHSRIDAIRFEGGLLDKVRVPFSPHLNCLIGIRGSGKSAILEAIRYALDIPFGQVSQDKKYKQDLLPYVLQSGGKVIVEASDKHGARYEINRIVNHTPDVYFEGELQPGISIRETVIWKPLYFGQKDLAAAGKGFGHDLVEKLVGDSLKPVRQKIDVCEETLREAVDALKSLETDVEQKEQEEGELEDVRFRLEQFKKHGVKDKLDKQVGFGSDIAYCEQIEEMVDAWSGAISASIEETEEAIENIEDHESKYNKETFVRFGKKYDEFVVTVAETKAVLGKIEKVSEGLIEIREEIEESKEGLKDSFAETEREIVKALADQGVTSIKPDEYVELSKQETELVSSIAELKRKTAKYDQKRKAVLAAIAALNNAWLEEYTLVNTALQKINQTQSALKVEASFKGSSSHFIEKMEDVFRGNSIRTASYKSLSEKYADFGEIYKALDDASKETKSKADVFAEEFNNNLYDLLSFQIPNSYKVTYHGKDLKAHSLGQRASAMMLFILSQKDSDLLLIDQPEDDLDGQSIYEEVVKLIRELKPQLQFIFATHNANFPVLGDSEMIVGCQFDEEKISVECASIDSKSSQRKVVDIMEGGKEAFERRKAIYKQWEH